MSLSRNYYKNRACLVTGIIITLVVSGIYIFKPAYLHLMEYKLYDTVFQAVYAKGHSQAVAIVDIDEYSLERFGQWPWPRYRVALLLQKIHMAGAAAVGVDILFAEPDGTSPAVLRKWFKKDLDLEVSFSEIPQALMDNDRLLADILGQGSFVLGYSFVFDPHQGGTTDSTGHPHLPPELKAAEITSPGAGSAAGHLFQAEKMIPPLPVLMATNTPAGFMNTVTDPDGVLRRTPLMISLDRTLYPQLALATLLTAFQGRIPDPVIRTGKGGIESIRIGRTVVPLQPDGSMLINYRGRAKTFPYVSAGKILEDRISGKELEGKIVFLGTSAAGLKDIRISPLDPVFPGVEVHATIVDNILSNDILHRPDWIPGLELFSIVFWGIAATFLIGWAGAGLTLPVTVLMGALAWYGSVWALGHHKIWISSFFPMMVLFLTFSILNLQKFWISEKRKKFFRSAFSKYVSKAVVDQLAEHPEKLSLDGEEKEISVLFSDIRGFTALSERLTPTQVTLLLHDYFTPVTRIIIDHQGTHDKFLGDAVMCFWNAPLDVPGHQGLAIEAALKILALLPELNRAFEQDYGIRLDIGIGLHAGPCRVGNMGSEDIFDYTIIGDNVNLASRLEGLTKFYGVPLIVSEAMLEQGRTKDLQILELDLVRVKGKKEPVRIFSIFAPRDGERDLRETEIQAHAQGLELYRSRMFEKAGRTFSDLAARFPDRPLYALYRDRCDFFITHPPDKSWDGIFSHTSK
jgi:adenylate cyclase